MNDDGEDDDDAVADSPTAAAVVGGTDDDEVEGIKPSSSSLAAAAAAAAAAADASGREGGGNIDGSCNATKQSDGMYQHVRISIRYHYRFHNVAATTTTGDEKKDKKNLRKEQNKRSSNEKKLNTLKKKKKKKAPSSPPSSSPGAPSPPRPADSSTSNVGRMADDKNSTKNASNDEDEENDDEKDDGKNNSIKPKVRSENIPTSAAALPTTPTPLNTNSTRTATAAEVDTATISPQQKTMFHLLPRAVRELCDFNGPGRVIGYGNNFIHGEWHGGRQDGNTEKTTKTTNPLSNDDGDDNDESREGGGEGGGGNNRRRRRRPKRASSSSYQNYNEDSEEDVEDNDNDDGSDSDSNNSEVEDLVDDTDEQSDDDGDDNMSEFAEETLIAFDRYRKTMINLSDCGGDGGFTNSKITQTTSSSSSSMTLDEIIAKAVQRMNLPTTARTARKVTSKSSTAVSTTTQQVITYGLYVVYTGGKQTNRMIRVFESSDLQDGDQCELIDMSLPSSWSRADSAHCRQGRMDVSLSNGNKSIQGTLLPIPPVPPGHNNNHNVDGPFRHYLRENNKQERGEEYDQDSDAHDYDRAIDILKARYTRGSVLCVDLDGRRFFDAIIEKINPNIRRYASLTDKAKNEFKEYGKPKFWVYLRFSSSLDSVGMRKSQWYDVQSVRHFILSRPESLADIKSSSKNHKKYSMNKEEPVAIVYNDMEDVVSNDTFTSPTDVSVGDHVSVQWDDGHDYTGTVIKVLPWVRGADMDTDVDYQKRIDEATFNSPSSSSVAVCVKYDDGDICWSNVEEEDGFIILERAKPKKKLDRSSTEESTEIENTQQGAGLDDSVSRPLPVKQRHERRRKTQNSGHSRSKRKNEATAMQMMRGKRNKTL